MWKRRLALTLTLAILLLAAPASALDPSTTLETAPTISPNSTNTFSTPQYNTQRRYYKLELPHAGIVTVSLLVYDRDRCPYFDIELRDRINMVQGNYKKMASGNTGYQAIVNSSTGTPVPLFTAEVPAGSYFLSIFPADNVSHTLVCAFTCPHSNYPYTAETVDPTCAASGRTYKVCGNCGDNYDTQIIDPLPHTLAKDGWTVVKAATCTANGSETQTCSVCKKLQTRTLYSLGHDYGDWDITPATCTAQGSKSRTCGRCGKVETQTLPLRDHTYSTWVTVTPASCAASGKLLRVCSACGKEETQFLPPTGHSYGDWAVTQGPTCTAQGVETQTCPLCGAAQTRAVDKVPHEYGDWAVTREPTCIVFGEETQTCLHCPAAKTRDVPMTEHTYGEWRVTDLSTCSHRGEATRSCAQCRKSETKRLDMLPHQYTCWELSKSPTAESSGSLLSRCDYGCGKMALDTIFPGKTYLAPMAAKGKGYQCWWGCDPERGAIALKLPEGHALFAACYDDQGNFLEVKQVTLDAYTHLTGCLEKARLFLLDEALVPQDASQVIFDHPISQIGP